MPSYSWALLSPPPLTPPARLAPHSSPSPPQRVFPDPPGALWADVLGLDCLVTVATESGWTRALAASGRGRLKFGARGGNAEAAGARKSGEPGQVSGTPGAGRVVFPHFVGSRCHLWALRRRAGRGGRPPGPCPPTSGGRDSALKVALLSPPWGRVKVGLSLGAVSRESAPHVEDAGSLSPGQVHQRPSAPLAGRLGARRFALLETGCSAKSPPHPVFTLQTTGEREKGCGVTAWSRAFYSLFFREWN